MAAAGAVGLLSGAALLSLMKMALNQKRCKMNGARHYPFVSVARGNDAQCVGACDRKWKVVRKSEARGERPPPRNDIVRFDCAQQRIVRRRRG